MIIDLQSETLDEYGEWIKREMRFSLKHGRFAEAAASRQLLYWFWLALLLGIAVLPSFFEIPIKDGTHIGLVIVFVGIFLERRLGWMISMIWERIAVMQLSQEWMNGRKLGTLSYIADFVEDRPWRNDHEL